MQDGPSCGVMPFVTSSQVNKDCIPHRKMGYLLLLYFIHKEHNMAGRLSDWVWKLRLSQSEKLVLGYVISTGDFYGERCYPFVDTISESVDLSIRQVQRCLASLRAQGILEVVENGGRGKPTVYKVHPENGVLKDGSKGDIRTERVTPNVIETPVKGDMGDTTSIEKGDMGDTPETERVTFDDIKGDMGDIEIAKRVTFDDIKGDIIVSPSYIPVTLPVLTLPVTLPSLSLSHAHAPDAPAHDTTTTTTTTNGGGSTLRDRLKASAGGVPLPYQTVEAAFTEFWSKYPKHRRGSKSDLAVVSRSIELGKWGGVITALDHYLASSDVKRNIVMKAERFLLGEWENYEDGPVVETVVTRTEVAPTMTQAQQNRAHIREVVEQGKAYIEARRNGTEQYYTLGEVTDGNENAGVDKVRPRRIYPQGSDDFGGFGTMLAFPRDGSK